MPRLAAPLALRRDAKRGLTAVIMAPAGDCFAVSMPYGEDGHRSVYLSLFGRDLKAGETASARARMVIGKAISDQQAIELYEAYRKESGNRPLSTLSTPLLTSVRASELRENRTMIELGMHTDNWRTLERQLQDGRRFGRQVSAVAHRVRRHPRAVLRQRPWIRPGRLAAIESPRPAALPGPERAAGLADRRRLSADGARRLDLRRAVRPAERSASPPKWAARSSTRPTARSRPKATRDEEVFRITCENYRQCLSWAEDYDVILNIETHGPYTTNGDFLERLFTHFESEHLRFNFDTGNTFISGQDPLEYLKRFRKYLSHAHIKDVSPGLAAAVRGEETGIACSEVPVGGGVNAENIKKCIAYLRETQWNGVLSIECYGADDNIRKSVEFLRKCRLDDHESVRHALPGTDRFHARSSRRTWQCDAY